MAKMTGGQALMKSLYREGVRVIFGLPGVQLYHAMDALYDEPGIRFISTRHEQATAYMADGYSRAGGGIGTALVVPGPGLLNAAAAISTAYSASSPIMVVSGQVERDLIGVNRGMLHEVNDQLEAVRPITKFARRILDPAEVPEAVHEAFHHLKNGRPRPVEIEIPPETPGRGGRRRVAGAGSSPAVAAGRRKDGHGGANDRRSGKPFDMGRRRRDIVRGVRCSAPTGRAPASSGRHHCRGKGRHL